MELDLDKVIKASLGACQSEDGITQRVGWLVRCRKADVTLKESLSGTVWLVYARGKIENVIVVYSGTTYYIVPKGTDVFKDT